MSNWQTRCLGSLMGAALCRHAIPNKKQLQRSTKKSPLLGNFLNPGGGILVEPTAKGFAPMDGTNRWSPWTSPATCSSAGERPLASRFRLEFFSPSQGLSTSTTIYRCGMVKFHFNNLFQLFHLGKCFSVHVAAFGWHLAACLPRRESPKTTIECRVLWV